MDDHPIRLSVGSDLHRSRLTVFFRLLLAIPHFVWLTLWTVAALVAAIAGWVAALALGRLPSGLHGFLTAYVRYGTHVAAYLGLLADPYPGFRGEPGYPVDVTLPEPVAQPRAAIAARLLLALPALLLAAALGSGFGGGSWGQESWGGGNAGRYSITSGVGGVAAVCAVLGWFACLAVGRMPLGLRNLGAYGVGYTAQAYAYALLLTGRYPSSDPRFLGPSWELPPHPVTLLVDDDRRRSRLTVLFRLLLVLPHAVWLTLWSIAALLAALVNGAVALARGRSAGPLHRFLAAFVRYRAHVGAFVSLVANPFPGFTGAGPYPVDVEIAGPDRQSRWVTLFRLVLAIPAFVLSLALGGVLFVVAVLGWFAALVTGRMPEGLRNLGAVCIRYLAQTDAYFLVVHDRYPHASPALEPPLPPVEEEDAAEDEVPWDEATPPSDHPGEAPA